ncbi:hypothetical protein [Actinacidiphila sp. ITFR-21]|uniref:hypothetical protein n=1 Tax=Actinacidiphila sp. ITFR-21 TaxID=3075199 RepID=UPI00288AA4C2|nr:hypothetical protein [Streptomyces sp. ITFR-21]WNI17105.1 hypothetical protein RLT57_17320 [Streptomyces sp. ITFR-21]
MRGIAPVATASALLGACVAVAGCGTDATGARREGPAPSVSMKTRPAAVPAIVSDPGALAGMVRRDTGVSAGVRRDLAPCGDDGYPMDTDAGDLTAGDGPELVVNVTTCGDRLGIAAYVYRMVGGKYRCVFADEHGPVYGSVDDGRLEVVHEVFPSDDPVAYPTGEESATYTWRTGHFVQTARSFTGYGAPSPTASPEPTFTAPMPLPSSAPLDPGLPAPAPRTGTQPQTQTGTQTGTWTGTQTRTAGAVPPGRAGGTVTGPATPAVGGH